MPIITARANSVGNILKTEKGTHFRAQYIQEFTRNCLENCTISEQLLKGKIQTMLLDTIDQKHLQEEMYGPKLMCQ
jgi:hypothetical protein